MASEIQIVVSMTDNASEAAQTLGNNVADSAEKAGEKFDQFVQKAEVGSAVIAAALFKVGDSILENLSDFEHLRLSLKETTGSTQQAAEMMKYLQDTSKNSMFDVPQLGAAAEKFTDLHVPMAKIKEIFPAIIDYAAALGNDEGKLVTVSQALAKAESEHVLKGRELNQMMSAGVPVYEVLAQAIKENKIHVDGLSEGWTSAGDASKKLTAAAGKATETLAVHKAELAVNEERLKKLSEAHKDSGASADLLRARIDQQRATLQQSQGVIKDYGDAHAEAGKKVFSAGASLDEIQDKLIKNSGKMKISGEEFATVISEYLGKRYMGAAAEQADTLDGALHKLGEDIKQTTLNAVGWTDAGIRQGSIVDRLTGQVSQLQARFDAIAPAIVSFTQAVLNNQVAITLLFGALAGMITLGIIALVTALGPALIAIGALGLAFGAIGLAIQGLMGWFPGLSTAISDVAKKYDLLGQNEADAAKASKAFHDAEKSYENNWKSYQELRDKVTISDDELTKATARAHKEMTKFKEGTPEWAKADLALRQAQDENADAHKKLSDIAKTLSGDGPGGISDVQKKSDEAAAAMKKNSEVVKEHASFWGDLFNAIGNTIKKMVEYIGKSQEAQANASTFGLIQHHAHGGIVDGPLGQPVPIIAHGGERVLNDESPSNSGGGGMGGVTINFTGSVSMDDSSRIQELADKIGKVLGRQNELARFGAGY